MTHDMTTTDACTQDEPCRRVGCEWCDDEFGRVAREAEKNPEKDRRIRQRRAWNNPDC